MHVNCIVLRNHLHNGRPAERSEGRTYVVVFPETGYQSCREMQYPLQSVQVGIGGTTTDRRAVVEVGEDMGLNEDIE